MGKRKRSGTSFHPSSSDSRPCSSGRDLTPGESNSSAPDNGNIFKSHPSVKETMDTRGKQPSSQLSLGQHQHNLSRSVFWKRSRHHYGNQYSRRNSPNYHKPSTSYGKSNPFPDERLCFTLGSKYNSDIGHRPDFAEFRESAFWRPERIRSSPSVIHAISPEAVRMTCGVCQKSLRRKPHNFGSTLGPEELSIDAVLVCGHIFHANCLERRTQVEDKRDPPCPICSGFDPQIELIDLERDS